MLKNHQKPVPMRLLFVGDVMLGRLVNKALTQLPPEYPWGDTLPLFQQANVRICNLECALTDGGTAWSAYPKVFHFRSDAKNVAVLQAAQIVAVSLANNHSLDFGSEGLVHTMTTLTAAGIHFAGAGRNAEEASTPAIWATQGNRLGLIALTDNEPGWEATQERAGVFYVPVSLHDTRTERLLKLISKTKECVDWLIVSAHWGPNWGYLPPADHLPFAHALIDAGADILFGHSGHVVRGVELYKGKPILYCTGDFIDDYAVDPVERNDHSFIFLLETEGQTMKRLLLYPTVITHFQARRATGQEGEAIVTTMQRLCTDLQTLTTWNEQEERLEVQVAG